MTIVLVIVALGLLGLAAVWLIRVPVAWRAAKNVSANHSRSAGEQEQLQAAWISVVRDIVLGVLAIGMAAYVLGVVGQDVVVEGVRSLTRGGEADTVGSVVASGSPSVAISQRMLHISLAIASFFIVAALVYPIVPGILPRRGESRIYDALDIAIALSLAGFLALFIAVPSQASNRLVETLANKLSDIMVAFTSVLLGAIGAYLFWKNIWRHIKPK